MCEMYEKSKVTAATLKFVLSNQSLNQTGNVTEQTNVLFYSLFSLFRRIFVQLTSKHSKLSLSDNKCK